jgi:hypothetical protein
LSLGLELTSFERPAKQMQAFQLSKAICGPYDTPLSLRRRNQLSRRFQSETTKREPFGSRFFLQRIKTTILVTSQGLSGLRPDPHDDVTAHAGGC